MAPHRAQTLLHEVFITHTFQICCISTRDTHSVWCSVPKSAELLFPLAAGEIRLFSSPHVSQCLTYIRKKNESSTNPHPNSQTFLNPKQESQACDKKRYSCPHLSLIFLFFNFFFIYYFLFAKIYQSKLMTFIIICCVQKLQRYDLPLLSGSEVSL